MFAKLFADGKRQSAPKGAAASARPATSTPSRATIFRPPSCGPTCCSTGQSSNIPSI